MSETQDKRNRVCEIGRQSDQLIPGASSPILFNRWPDFTLRFVPTFIIQNSTFKIKHSALRPPPLHHAPRASPFIFPLPQLCGLFDPMPEISRFLGVVISMYFDEHNPPHFHVRYNEWRAVVSINNK